MNVVRFPGALSKEEYGHFVKHVEGRVGGTLRVVGSGIERLDGKVQYYFDLGSPDDVIRMTFDLEEARDILSHHAV